MNFHQAPKYLRETKVWDYFIFNDELELLNIRLNTMNDYVDRFVLVEANRTFTGQEKPFVFEENKNKFASFLDKIEHVKVNDMPVEGKAWDREKHQRNSMKKAVPDSESICFVSDVDEIISAYCLRYWWSFKVVPEPFSLTMAHYKWYLNRRDIYDWYYAKACSGQQFMLRSPHQIRHSGLHENRIIRNSGWHMNYLGGKEAVMRKTSVFSHSEDVGFQEWFDKLAKADRPLDEFFGGVSSCDLTELPDFVQNNERYYRLIGFIK